MFEMRPTACGTLKGHIPLVKGNAGLSLPRGHFSQLSQKQKGEGHVTELIGVGRNLHAPRLFRQTWRTFATVGPYPGAASPRLSPGFSHVTASSSQRRE